MRNLGTPVFPKRLFQILMEEHAGESVILLVESDGIPISGVLTFFDGGQALPYYGGTLASAYRYSASDYMYWSLMCHAADRGCTVFDFGRSKRDTGAFHYKRHWGVRADAARLSVRAGARSRRPRPEPEEPALLAGHPRLEADPPLDRGAHRTRDRPLFPVNLLYLAHRIPYPPDKGDKIRSYHQLRFLAARHRVHLVCFADDRRDLAHADVLREFCASVDVVYRSGRAARIAGLRGLLDGRAISVAAFDSGALRRAAAARLRGADAVLAFSSVMAPYAPAAEGRPRVMDFVDADSEKWRDYAARSAGPAAWIYAREADRLGRFETAVASSWDQSLFVCEREARVIRARAPEPRSG